MVVKEARYYNPFPGKPIPLQLSGLFLLDPSVEMKLAGHSFRALFSEIAEESLYKRLERTMQGKQAAKLSLVEDLLGKMPQHPALDDLRAAARGDEIAQVRLDSQGPWETFAKAATITEGAYSAKAAHFIAIERACAEPQRAIKQGDFSLATEQLINDPLMSRFLWPEALVILRGCSKKTGLLSLQASGCIEVLLSALAAWDTEIEKSYGREADSRFSCILPCPQNPGKNGTSLFFGWLKERVGATSISGLLSHRKATELSLDLGTLKRWSSGSHHPDPVWLRLLVLAFFGDANDKEVWTRYWAAKYLNFIGFIAQQCSGRARQFIGTQSEKILAPWPVFPFGYTSFDTWCQARYPYWLEYHRQNTQDFSTGSIREDTKVPPLID